MHVYAMINRMINVHMMISDAVISKASAAGIGITGESTYAITNTVAGLQELIRANCRYGSCNAHAQVMFCNR